MIQNDLLLKVAKGEKTDHTPVWLMRQAGRILPEYRALRKKVKDFKHLVKTPELAAEVTLQPIKALNVDAAIIFSDILVVPEAMGLPYKMIENKGPYFEQTLQDSHNIDKLKEATEEDFGYVLSAIRLTKKGLNDAVPLIGFAGAPWTIFLYMVEGSGSKTFAQGRKMMYHNPELTHKILDKITTSTIGYLRSQIESGVDIIQIFDSWAEILPHDAYHTFSLPYIQRICDALQDVPKIVFAKGAWHSLQGIYNSNCDVVGIDWNVPIQWARNQLPHKAIQGNMDPCLLYSDLPSIKKATLTMLHSFKNHLHIANLGHGVYPDTPLDHVKCFVECVKNYDNPTQPVG